MKVIQLTDLHLFAHDELEIFGVKSNLKFKEVMAKIIVEESIDTDLILLTGDISQDETKESYQKVVDHLSDLNIPIYWIPGNHDDIPNLQEAFQNAKNFHRKNHLSLPEWHFIFLNTKEDGTGCGYLAPSELEMLNDELIAAPLDKKIAVVMHHHPIPVCTPLIDNYILKNRDEFWSVITNTNVSLVICGHVHGDYQIKHNHIMLESSPATCLQWVKGTKELKIDPRIGYKIYQFCREGYRATTKLW